MMNRTAILIIALLVLPLLAACSRNTSSVRPSRPTVAHTEDDHAALAAIPRITPSEADSLVKQGQAVIVDVRAEAAYRSQRIKGAMSMPEAQTMSRMSTLPRDKKIITYCT